MNSTADNARLIAYLEGEAKYHILPVPTPLERATAVAFVTNHLPTALQAERAVKLCRVATLYDLHETAAGFVHLLRLSEAHEQDYARSATAIEAIVWLGNEEQKAEARDHFKDMLSRIELEHQRELMLHVADSLGSEDCDASFKAALARIVTNLKQKLADASAHHRPEEAVNLENRVARLDEFCASELPALERGSALRRDIESEPDMTARISRLTAIYLGENPEFTPALQNWAGLKLVGFPDSLMVANEFLNHAKHHERTDTSMQEELDAIRARALRAASFFGGPTPDMDRRWLAKQIDEGTDLLVLRPDWVYPNRHSH